VLEDLEDVGPESVDVEVDAVVHVVHVRLVVGERVQRAAHAERGVDFSGAVELPAVHVLVPAALELRRDLQPAGPEVARPLDGHLDCLGVDDGVERVRRPRRDAVGRRVPQGAEVGPAALGVEPVLVGVLGRRRLDHGAVVGHDRERLRSAPHHASAVEVRPPDLQAAALLLADAPVDRPTGA
jgi:hypothetical protein